MIENELDGSKLTYDQVHERWLTARSKLAYVPDTSIAYESLVSTIEQLELLLDQMSADSDQFKPSTGTIRVTSDDTDYNG